MFMDEAKGHDHQSQEFIVEFWLINDVSRNDTCSHKEINILNICFWIILKFRFIECEAFWASWWKSQFALPDVSVNV